MMFYIVPSLGDDICWAGRAVHPFQHYAEGKHVIFSISLKRKQGDV